MSRVFSQKHKSDREYSGSNVFFKVAGKGDATVCGQAASPLANRRLARCATIDEIVVATTTNEADDQIEQLCTNNQVACFRGSENDVLGRICAMLESFGAQVHAEFYGDSPLLDSDLVDHSVNVFLNNKGIDLLTNTLERTYPSGLEINVYSAYRLIELDREMPPDATMREHVCANLKLRPSRYNILNFTAPVEHCGLIFIWN